MEDKMEDQMEDTKEGTMEAGAENAAEGTGSQAQQPAAPTRKGRPKSCVVILDSKTGETVVPAMAGGEDELAAAIDKLGYGDYVVRRYTDRAFSKVEVRKPRIKFD